MVSDGRLAAPVADDARIRRATRAVYAVFIGHGFAFASWASASRRSAVNCGSPPACWA